MRKKTTQKQNGSASGGRKLRMVRERQGLKQTDLAMERVITQGNYSQIEQGRSFALRETLEDILDALKATFNERQEVLTAFGYLPPYPLPNQEEIEAAIQRAQPVLNTVPMPAYLMDFVTRFLAWNRCFAKLQGQHENSGLLDGLKYVPWFKAHFQSKLRIGSYVQGMENYLLAEVQNIRERLAPYEDERWYEAFIEELCEEPEFRTYWQATENRQQSDDKVTEFAARALQPVRFNLPGSDMQLSFYANLDALVGDDRFQIVYLIPADTLTIRQVDRWREAEG